MNVRTAISRGAQGVDCARHDRSARGRPPASTPRLMGRSVPAVRSMMNIPGMQRMMSSPGMRDAMSTRAATNLMIAPGMQSMMGG